MRSRSIPLLALCALGGTAAAQPDDGAPPPEAAEPADPAATPPEPPPPPPSPPPADDADAPDDAPLPVAPAGPVPTGTTVGIGVGSRQPGSLSSLNVGSVRIRFGSGFSLEPTLVLGHTSQGNDTPGSTPSTATELSFGTALRSRFAARGRVELLGVLEASLSSLSQSSSDTSDVTSTAVGVAWGLAVDYWLNRHWAISLAATNPLVTYTAQEQTFGTDSMKTSSTTYGLIADPTFTVMVHLFY